MQYNLDQINAQQSRLRVWKRCSRRGVMPARKLQFDSESMLRQSASILRTRLTSRPTNEIPLLHWFKFSMSPAAFFVQYSGQNGSFGSTFPCDFIPVVPNPGQNRFCLAIFSCDFHLPCSHYETKFCLHFYQNFVCRVVTKTSQLFVSALLRSPEIFHGRVCSKTRQAFCAGIALDCFLVFDFTVHFYLNSRMLVVMNSLQTVGISKTDFPRHGKAMRWEVGVIKPANTGDRFSPLGPTRYEGG